MREPLVFIHLSDIHFNKKGMDHYDLDKDLRDQIEKDVARMRPKFTSIKGVLVSGDVAFGGRKEEYDEAQAWLKKLCELAGCREQNVWCVPGNHDVDRAVYEGSPLLQDLHNTLRPTEPERIDEIDEMIPRYLRDSMAGPLLFKPIEQYNDFAALFSCASHPNPLCWHDDLELNDGSILRLYGINSTLVCDRTDDNHKRRMIVGTIQSRPEETDGVTYLAMCHHPPDWLLDQDNFVNSINSRVRVQLYGHKHIHRVTPIDNCLRIGSGAVHPSRKEKGWLPRYNWLKLSVRKVKKNRFLDVEVHPRHWYEADTKFIAGTAACDGAESKVYSLNLPEWTAAPAAPISVSTAGGAGTGGAAMVTVDSADAARTLTYRFLDLSHVTRIEIAQQLDLYKNEDEGVRDPELLARIFRRATDGKLLSKLWELVEKEHNDGLQVTNPYEGR
jgi:hypothetical protein